MDPRKRQLPRPRPPQQMRKPVSQERPRRKPEPAVGTPPEIRNRRTDEEATKKVQDMLYVMNDTDIAKLAQTLERKLRENEPEQKPLVTKARMSSSSSSSSEDLTLKDLMKQWPGFGVVQIPNRAAIIPPGVYFDENLARTLPQKPLDVDKALGRTGPFAVGEAKATLDDLQAHLLSLWTRLYKIDPSMPLDWQIEQLSQCHFPSPVPISPPEKGAVDSDSKNLANLAGALPPPFPNTVNVEDRPIDSFGPFSGKPSTDVSGKPTAEVKPSTDVNGKPTAEAGGGAPPVVSSDEWDEPPTVVTSIKDAVDDLTALAERSRSRVQKLQRALEKEVGDPTTTNFWRGDVVSRALRRPQYFSKRHPLGHLNELEDHIETMYRNLTVEAQWNQKKIRLLRDKINLLNQPKVVRQDPRNAM